MHKRTYSLQLTPEYIVGLVDGEGSFTIYVKDPDAEKVVARRVRVEPKFYIKLVEKDKSILYALQEYFQCGNVYFQKDTRPNHQHCYRYEVFRWEDLQSVIIPFFKKHRLLFPSKRNDFEIFCKMMALLKKEVHKTEKGLRMLYALKQQMH